MSDVVVGATCILDRSKILGWEGSRLAKMTDDEEELGTDQVPADAMRSICGGFFGFAYTKERN